MEILYTQLSYDAKKLTSKTGFVLQGHIYFNISCSITLLMLQKVEYDNCPNVHDLWRSASHSCSSCVFCCHLLEAVSVEIWPHINSWSSSWTSSRSVVFLPSLKITLYPSYLKIHLISHSVFIIVLCSYLWRTCAVFALLYISPLSILFSSYFLWTSETYVLLAAERHKYLHYKSVFMTMIIC